MLMTMLMVTVMFPGISAGDGDVGAGMASAARVFLQRRSEMQAGADDGFFGKTLCISFVTTLPGASSQWTISKGIGSLLGQCVWSGDQNQGRRKR